jgi:hypothetical protein
MGRADTREPFREHLGGTARSPTAPPADVDTECHGLSLGRQVFQRPPIAAVARMRSLITGGTARRRLSLGLDQHASRRRGHAEQSQRSGAREKLVGPPCSPHHNRLRAPRTSTNSEAEPNSGQSDTQTPSRNQRWLGPDNTRCDKAGSTARTDVCAALAADDRSARSHSGVCCEADRPAEIMRAGLLRVGQPERRARCCGHQICWFWYWSPRSSSG